MTPQEMYKNTKQEQAKSKGKVAAADKKLQMDEYAQFAKTAGKQSKWKGDPDIESDYKLQQMIAKLREQFPEMTYAELVELAKVQLGRIDPNFSGKAQSRPGPSTGKPYNAQDYRDYRTPKPDQAFPPRQPTPEELLSYQRGGPVSQENKQAYQAAMPALTKAPGSWQPGAPPPMAGGQTVSKVGGSTISTPGWIADEKQHQLWYERQRREAELAALQQQASEAEYMQQMKREQQAMELQKLREQMEYDKFMRDMEMQKAKREMAPTLGGLMAPTLERKPVTYLGG